MKKTFAMALLCAAAAMVSCKKDDATLSTLPDGANGLQQIALSIPDSRVNIGDDGLTVTWGSSDRLQLLNFTEGTGYDATASSTYELLTGANTKNATFQLKADAGPGIESGKKYILTHTAGTSQIGNASGKVIITPKVPQTQASAADYAHIRSNIIYTCPNLIDGDAPDYSGFAPCQSVLELRLSLAAASTTNLMQIKVKAPGQWFIKSYTYEIDGTRTTETTDELTLGFTTFAPLGTDPEAPLVARMLVWWNPEIAAVSGNVQVTLTMDDGKAATVPFTPTKIWTAGAKYKMALAGISGFAASADDMPVVVGDTYHIFTVAQLRKIGEMNTDGGSSTFQGKTIKIMNDLDLQGSAQNPWTPLGIDKDHYLAGTLDGNNKTISNLYINSTSDGQSLIGFASNSLSNAFRVKDLTIDKAEVVAASDAARYTAVLIGVGRYVTIENCVVRNAKISATYVSPSSSNTYLGCLICLSNKNGDDTYVTITGCTMEEVELSHNKNHSALIFTGSADMLGSVTISDCLVKDCKMTATAKGAGVVMSAAPTAASVNIARCEVRNCTLDFTGTDENHGGLVGTASGVTKIVDCKTTGGTFTMKGTRTLGGICGNAMSGAQIIGCQNSAKIVTDATSGNALANLGGICGLAEANVRIFGCKNTAEIISGTGTNWRIGGIVGNNSGAVIACYNTGKIQQGAANSSTFGGGIVGINQVTGKVSGCYNNSIVENIAATPSYARAGAICGESNASVAGVGNSLCECSFWTDVANQSGSLKIIGTGTGTDCGKAPTVWAGVGSMTKGWTEAPTDWNATNWGAWTSPWVQPFPGSASGSYPQLYVVDVPKP